MLQLFAFFFSGLNNGKKLLSSPKQVFKSAWPGLQPSSSSSVSAARPPSRLKIKEILGGKSLDDIRRLPWQVSLSSSCYHVICFVLLRFLLFLHLTKSLFLSRQRGLISNLSRDSLTQILCFDFCVAEYFMYGCLEFSQVRRIVSTKFSLLL